MKKAKPLVDNDPADFGTSELGRRFSVVPKLTRGNYGYNAKVLDETELDRLLLADRITAAEHSTLEALLKRLHKSAFVGLKSPSYDAVISADASIVADKKAQTIRSMVKIIDKMDNHAEIGRANRAALINLVLLDIPWAASDGVLKDCCKALDYIFTNRERKF